MVPFHLHRSRYFPSFCLYFVLSACRSHFLFLITASFHQPYHCKALLSDSGAPRQEGKRATFSIYFVLMGLHHHLLRSGKLHPLGAQHWHICGRGLSLGWCVLICLGWSLEASDRCTCYALGIRIQNEIFLICCIYPYKTEALKGQALKSCIRSEYVATK